jgi:hypothetical protein
MLKVPRRLRPTTIGLAAATALVVVAFAGLVSAGSALADHGRRSEPPVTLNGAWAQFNRCPVDEPEMLAANGTTVTAFCSAQNSPNGSMTIGNLTVTTKHSGHQFGLLENDETGSWAVVEPENGGLSDESLELPGGLRGLICPSHGRFDANVVTWTMEAAGVLTEFNLFAGLAIEAPIGTQPVKIHLQNALLGRNCYIGSTAEPILLHAGNTTQPTLSIENFELNGTPNAEGKLEEIVAQASQGDNKFAVPAASGCGHMGFFDQAIDNKIGLPSPSGKNDLVFNEASSALIGLIDLEEIGPNDGKELSKSWHSAVVPTPPEEGNGHGFGHDSHWGGGRHWYQHEFEEEFHHKFRHHND